MARSLEQGGALRPLVWAGLALGAGMTVKPQAGLYWLGCAAAAAWGAWRERRSVVAGAGAVLGAGLLVPALVFGWLGWRGGLGAFMAILTGYLLPLYSHVGRVSALQALGTHRHGWLVLVFLGVLGLLALLGPAPEGSGARRALALLGVAYGWLHFSLQGKGWEYHLYPLAFFLCALAPFALASTGCASGRGRWLARRRVAALIVLAALVVTLGAKGVEALDAPWVAEKARRVAAVSRDLAPLLRAGDTAQVMDVTEGGVHVLLRLGVRQPTRFIYDFHFFHDQADPRIKALQTEFVAGLDSARPAAIVVMRDTWNRPGYERLREVPGLMPLLDRAYTLAAEGDAYRIYAKRAGS